MEDNLKDLAAHVGIVIFLVIGNILVEPFGGDKCFRRFLTAEFHFRHNQWRKGRVENIQFDGKCIVVGRSRETLLESGIA